MCPCTFSLSSSRLHDPWYMNPKGVQTPSVEGGDIILSGVADLVVFFFTSEI